MVNVSVSITSLNDDVLYTNINGFAVSSEDLTYDEAEQAVIGVLNENDYDVEYASLNKVASGNYLFNAQSRNKNYDDIMNFISKRR